MGLFDKLKNNITPENEGVYDDQDIYTSQLQNDYNDTQMYQQPQPQPAPGYVDPSYAVPQQPMQDDGMQVSGSSLELKVVKPQHFESVPQIADHLLNKRTVVLNLENTNKETARRLIDFLSGVAYSIDGSLKKIASNAYVITPSNVDVGDAQLKDRRARAEAQRTAAADTDTLGGMDDGDLGGF